MIEVEPRNQPFIFKESMVSNNMALVLKTEPSNIVDGVLRGKFMVRVFQHPRTILLIFFSQRISF